MRSRLTLVALGGLLGLFVAFGSSAAEQTEQPEPTDEVDLPSVDALGDVYWLSSTSSTSTTMTAAVGVFSVQLATPRTQRLMLFLRHNGRALQRDLHLGGGDALADLGALLGVDDDRLRAFGRAMYQRRDRLVPLADPTHLDLDRTRAFAAIASQQVCAVEINPPVPSVVSRDDPDGIFQAIQERP